MAENGAKEKKEVSVASDVKLDEGHDNWVTIEGTVLRARTADFILDSPERRGPGGGAHRRALVHDQRDGLTLNFNGDYPGGVKINNARINLAVVDQSAGEPRLPKSANVGDMLMIVNTKELGGHVVAYWCSLWLCVPSAFATPAATWQKIQLGDVVQGTE
jgi:hypothetical protein